MEEFVIDTEGRLTQYNGEGGDVVIPEGVTAIGDRVFDIRRNKNIRSLKIPDSVISIGDYALCNSIEELELPKGLQYLGRGALSLCVPLAHVAIPEGIEELNGMFLECVSLQSVVLPQSLKTIGPSTFLQCYELVDLRIPEGVTEIGYRAFKACWSLTHINIPQGVTQIASNTFEECYNLSKIQLPEGIISIGSYAFCSTAPKEVRLPTTLKILEGGAFAFCQELERITIPEGMIEIGGSAFFACRKLKEVELPQSITSIYKKAFESCESLEQIKIPAAVSYIGEDAFYGCSNLVSIMVEKDNSHYRSIDGLLYDKSGKTLLCCPAGKKGALAIPDGTEVIGRHAFAECRGLTQLTFPPSVKRIEKDAFYLFEGDVSITLPEGLEEIGDSAFFDFDGSAVHIPQSVTRIGKEAFYGCCRLEELTIPSSVTHIGKDAFCWIKNLVNLSRATAKNACDEHLKQGYLPFEDLKKATPAFKRLLVVCYLSAKEKYPPEKQAEYEAYIRRQSGRLLLYFAEKAGEVYLPDEGAYVALIRLLETGYVKQKPIDTALERQLEQEHEEKTKYNGIWDEAPIEKLKEALLAYKAKHFGTSPEEK